MRVMHISIRLYVRMTAVNPSPLDEDGCDGRYMEADGPGCIQVKCTILIRGVRPVDRFVFIDADSHIKFMKNNSETSYKNAVCK